MKKFLLHNYELGTWVYAFGKKFVLLRASRMIMPMLIFCAIIIVGDPSTYTFFWYHIPCYAIIGFNFYMGFLHYRFFPYDYNDLDGEQKYFYLSGLRKGAIPPYRLTPEQAKDLAMMAYLLEEEYDSAWKRYRNLIPLLISLIEIVVFYFMWI
jgi:hypothetical protein